MKKYLSLMLILFLGLSFFTGCGENSNNNENSNPKLVNISGTVYLRDSDTAYPLTASPAPVIGGATVTIDDLSITSEATTGNYQFTGVSAGYHTIAVSKPGYITSKVSGDFQADQAIDIGLYYRTFSH